ncbi:cupin domain-containing protein [Sphingobium yanoikuyae]|uniref:cupin domain-containing protein n=1 Tax=Sphingobium yanoikuyae TaxID=13690 RepID=UPI0026EA1D64|nr:cupin domain-containing protein [Sphingobium yanoikuyae]
MTICPAIPTNLLDIPAGPSGQERFEKILCRAGTKIERIISYGHRTPQDCPYLQQWDEWVTLLAGSAELQLEGMGLYRLRVGDHLLIPAGVAHWVTHCDDPTIWLAVHVGKKADTTP